MTHWMLAGNAVCPAAVADNNYGSASWFDADMCAVLGAILHKASNNVNAVVSIEINTADSKAYDLVSWAAALHLCN